MQSKFWDKGSAKLLFSYCRKRVARQKNMTLTGLYFMCLPQQAIAEEGFTMQGSITSMIVSLVIVVGVILLLAAAFKKLNIHPAASSAIKIISTQPIGTRERIIVIEVNGEQHLLGVTQQSVNHLFQLSEPLPSKSESGTSQAFKDKLQQAMGKHQQS